MTNLALEIGPTRFVAGRADLDGLHDVREIPVPAEGVWDACRGLLLDVAAGDQVDNIGIAAAGPIDMAAGIVAPVGIASWETGFDVVGETQKVFPVAEIRMMYAGVCAALAEQNLGDAGRVPDALVIDIGAHINAGVIIGGYLAVGRTGNAGHLGHMLVPGFDEPCVCGGRGCVAAVASESAAIEWARSQGWGGETAAGLITSAAAGDDAAVTALQRVGTALGRVISSAVSLLDIDLVLVGGTVARAEAMWPPLRAEVGAHTRMSFSAGVQVVGSRLERGVLSGAGIIALPMGLEGSSGN